MTTTDRTPAGGQEEARSSAVPSGMRAWLGSSRGGTGRGIYVVLVLVLVASWAIVAADGGSLLTVGNVRNMLVRSVSLGIVSVGQTLVILAGSIDLSVAYLISVAAVLASFIMNDDPSRIPLAVAVVLGVGVLVGAVNGLLVTKLRVHAFIATLGTGLVLRGLLSSRFSSFTGGVPREFQQLGYGLVGPIPLSVLLLLAVAVAAWWMLEYTPFGSSLYAVGGDLEVARLSGVRSDRSLIGAHIMCSVTAAITGLYIVARLGSGAPWVGPDGGYDLESIAAVVLGGTALMGGRGGVPGTIAAVFILAVLDNVFNQMQVDSFLKMVIRGVIIIAAVASYTLRSSREAEG